MFLTRSAIRMQADRASQRGAALLLMLVLVSVLGLAAGLAGQSWRSTMQQAREAELLWRGLQYQRAIASYYSVKHGPQQMYPAKLEYLIRDPRFPGVVRHLRKLYPDPMTGGDWELVRDPAERIIGVRSSSELAPFKQDGFPKELEKLQGKGAYSEWEFVFAPPATKGATTPPATTPPATTPPATTPPATTPQAAPPTRTDP